MTRYFYEYQAPDLVEKIAARLHELELDIQSSLDAFQPFYQETSLEQEVNVNLIHQTERELLDYTIYNQNDVAGIH